MTELKTRKPTGEVAWPTILVEGIHKSGKSALALMLSRSERVGRTFIAEVGEATADEYIEIGPFEILEHNGTYVDLFDQLKAATEVPQEDGKPNVIILDAGSAVHDQARRWGQEKANKSKAGRKILQDDPDADVSIPPNVWNEINDRWYDILNLLRAWPGIGIITTRAKEVAKFANGNPVAGQTEWTVECNKSTPFEVNAVVRAQWPNPPRLMSLRKWGAEVVPTTGRPIDGDNPLETLIFEEIGAGQQFGIPRYVASDVEADAGLTAIRAKQRLVDIFDRPLKDKDAATKEAGNTWAAAGLSGTTELTAEQWNALASRAAERVLEIVTESQKDKKEPST